MIPPDNLPGRERILLIGGQGAGKTRAVLSTVAAFPDSTFYVLDSDEAFPPRPNVRLYQCHRWEDWRSAAHEVAAAVQPGDWVVCDRISAPWDLLPDWAIEQVYGVDPTTYRREFIAKLRGDGKKGVGNPVLDLYQPLINPEWAAFWKDIFRHRGHVLFTAGAKEVAERWADDEVRNLYTGGIRPDTQRSVGFHMDAILLLDQHRPQRWRITTVRERTDLRPRRWMDHEALNDFAQDYLVGVAGWQVLSRPASPVPVPPPPPRLR